MKRLSQYVFEYSSKLSANERGIIVCDIDDTLITADKDTIHIIKYVLGDKKNIKILSTDEYSVDPDAAAHKDWFNYEEFRDPVKIMTSLVNGTPLLKNLKIMDTYLNNGYEFAFLTARGCEDVVKYAIENVIFTKDTEGNLKPLGDIFNKEISAAINDDSKNYEGITDQEKKANVLKSICSKYDKVVYIDDDSKNIQAARELNLTNLKIIKAL